MGASPAHRLIPVRSELLQPGMYVAELDRSWLHSPFAGKGFLITGPDQLEQLRQTCRYVYVDPDLSESADFERLGSGHAGRFGLAPPVSSPTPRVAAARNLLDRTLITIADVVRGARRQGIVDLAPLARCAEAIADQVAQAPDVLHWVLRMDDRGGFLYRRAAGTAVVSASLGRQLGFDHDTLNALALGGLLLDLGKVAVPVPILAKPTTLNVAEQSYVRRHVERGLELLAGRDVPARALEMLAGHHERMDGTGYPHHLRGTQIPLFGRIAALADSFDALTLNRRYAAATSPHAALRHLDTQRGVKFDTALVTELVHALGVYPVGTWVELLDGTAGLVCGQQPRFPVRPYIVVAHDAAQRPFHKPRVVEADGVTDIVWTLPPNVAPVDVPRLEFALGEFLQAAG